MMIDSGVCRRRDDSSGIVHGKQRHHPFSCKTNTGSTIQALAGSTRACPLRYIPTLPTALSM